MRQTRFVGDCDSPISQIDWVTRATIGLPNEVRRALEQFAVHVADGGGRALQRDELDLLLHWTARDASGAVDRITALSAIPSVFAGAPWRRLVMIAARELAVLDPEAETALMCSFCGRREDTITQLVVAPMAAICEACAHRAARMLT